MKHRCTVLTPDPAARQWLKCEAVLHKPPHMRSREDLDDMLKFTRKLDFFKHMAEASREILCRDMTMTSLPMGTMLGR